MVKNIKAKKATVNEENNYGNGPRSNRKISTIY